MRGVIAVTIGLFALGAALMAIANRRVAADAAGRRWVKLVTYFVIVHLVLACAYLGRPFLLALAAAIVLTGAWELRRALALARRELPRLVSTAWPIYAALCSSFALAVGLLDPDAVAWLYLGVAAFDGFSQISGQLLGRTPLAPKTSPNKTIEGLVGGIIGCLAVVWVFRDLAAVTAADSVIVGLAVAACSLTGDLTGSWLKRRAGIKDFSSLLPAHGGVLDRFNSFIATGAVVGPALYMWREAA